MAWQSSRRREQLPADWFRVRRRVLWECGHRCEMRLEGCSGVAQEVDHIRRGDDHSRENLRGVCTPCHRKKSSAEGHSRSAELRRLKKRPEGRHPGVL